MPTKPNRPCRYPGCTEMCRPGFVYCPKHNKTNNRDRFRGTAAERGYGSEWRRARDHYLQLHPLCVECAKKGIIRAASVVDHIVPHRGDQSLFWDQSNWQALCKSCHDQKTGSGL